PARVAEAPLARGGLRGLRLLPVVAVPVVLLALLGVGEDLVSFADLLEASLGGRVAGIQVWMVLTGQLAIGLPDVLVGRRAGHAENPVVVLLGCCHGPSPPGRRARRGPRPRFSL